MAPIVGIPKVISAARNLAVQMYSAAGFGESTSDLAWDGQGLIAERGLLLGETERFGLHGSSVVVDADLASNTLGWQWTAGCGADAAPYFRIFNPALQAARHDPDGAYVRRWLPDALRDYPTPIIDFRESRAAALAGYVRIKARG